MQTLVNEAGLLGRGTLCTEPEGRNPTDQTKPGEKKPKKKPAPHRATPGACVLWGPLPRCVGRRVAGAGSRAKELCLDDL